jgi:outer membrane protein OmpA-like peptidoglycan-associated protein
MITRSYGIGHRSGRSAGQRARAHSAGRIAATAPVATRSNQALQAKPEVGRSDDPLEREADRIADQVVQGRGAPPAISIAPSATIERQCVECAAETDDTMRRQENDEEEEDETIRMKPADGLAAGVGGAQAARQAASALSGAGTPLSQTLRAYFEPRFGRDFSDVRLHLDGASSAAAEAINARAYTLGRDIGFAAGHYAPHTPDGQRLLAHELAHVAQQAPGGTGISGSPRHAPTLRRRLLMDGAPDDVDGLLDILEPPSGLILFHNQQTAEVDITGAISVVPGSPSLASLLVRVVNDQNQNAEIHVGQAQPRVLVGAFPQPGDLTQGAVQRVDLDDIRMLEAGAPGNGVAAVAHEIEENFQAHGVTPIPGVDRFDVAHEQAIQSESDVAEELVGPGRRTARRIVTDATVVPNRITHAIDYQNYYLVIEATNDPATRNAVVTRSIQAARVEVSRRTIDRFGFNSVAVPFSGRGELSAAVSDVQANDLSTVTIEGHADSVGSDEVNVVVSKRRAEQTREAMINAGVEPGREKERFHLVGRGEAEPAADNETPEGRARNRRVVVTVSRPLVDIPAFL